MQDLNNVWNHQINENKSVETDATVSKTIVQQNGIKGKNSEYIKTFQEKF